MSIRIPLTFQPNASLAEGQPGLRLALPIGVGSAGAGSLMAATAGQTQALRAVAVAASLADPGKALDVVRETTEKGSVPIEKLKSAAQTMGSFLNEVVIVQEGSVALSANEDETELARVVGADPALVAAASSKIAEDKKAGGNLGELSLYWVAKLDPGLLERSANAAAQKRFLDFVPSQQTRLQRLEGRVTKLETAARGAGWQI